MACGNGSEKKPSAPSNGWAPLNAGNDNLVTRAIASLNIAPAVPVINIADFCSSPPPAQQEIGVLDWFSAPALLTKLTANALAFQWGTWCQCIPYPPGSVRTCTSVVSGSGLNVNGCGSLNNYSTVTYQGIVELVPHTHMGCACFKFIQDGVDKGTNFIYWTDATVDSVTCTNDETPPVAPPPPVYPPVLPPPPDVPMSPADKAELLLAIQQCYCPPNDGTAPADLTEVINRLTVLRDTTIPKVTTDLTKEILKTVPEYRVLVAKITTVPDSAHVTINDAGSRKIVAGWIMFKEEGKLYPREYINFDNSVFVAPVPGATLEYESYVMPGFTIDFVLGVIKIDNGETVPV